MTVLGRLPSGGAKWKKQTLICCMYRVQNNYMCDILGFARAEEAVLAAGGGRANPSAEDKRENQETEADADAERCRASVAPLRTKWGGGRVVVQPTRMPLLTRRPSTRTPILRLSVDAMFARGTARATAI
jgi:hypothetical protein